MSRYKELDCVVLRRPAGALPVGSVGVILLADLPGRYLVEFSDAQGRTLDELDLTDADLLPHAKAHVPPAP